MSLLSGIWSWLSTNWGNLASIVGAGLTIYYSRQAKSSADDAKNAAVQARTRVQTIDWVVQASEMISLIQDLLHRIDNNVDWSRASNDISKLRASAARCLGVGSPMLSSSNIKQLRKAPTQFAGLSNLIDCRDEPNSEPLNIPRIRRLLSDQLENYTVALDHVRQSASRTEHE